MTFLSLGLSFEHSVQRIKWQRYMHNINLKKLGRGLLSDATCQISKL